MNAENIKFSHKDTFSMDVALGGVIVNGLRKYLEVIRDSDVAGFPNCFCVGSKEIEGLKMECLDDVGCARWYAAIENMIYAFTDDEPEIGSGIIELVLMGEVDEEGEQNVEIKILDISRYDSFNRSKLEHEKKVSEGMGLFIKHYKDLWW